MIDFIPMAILIYLFFLLLCHKEEHFWELGIHPWWIQLVNTLADKIVVRGIVLPKIHSSHSTYPHYPVLCKLQSMIWDTPVTIFFLSEIYLFSEHGNGKMTDQVTNLCCAPWHCISEVVLVSTLRCPNTTIHSESKWRPR